MTDAGGSSLSHFDALIRDWFQRSVGKPTEVQERAWPEIARGSHVLVSAPTGTGKTLAAFLWAINQLATGALPPGKVRILYVSPLKALNNDIQRNLLSPLGELAVAFEQAGRALPQIRVLTRSGDTPQADRQRMLRHPPEILITTPESLNLILSSPNSRLMLDGLSTVILDEIHAVAATKRGTHLLTAVERLVRLAGEFQRIALSATVKPLSAVADLVGGFTLDAAGEEPVYRKRRVQIVHCPMTKEYDIRISFPPADAAAGIGSDEPVFDALGRECRRIIGENRATLFFVNSRRHAEKLARFINEGQPEPLAWSHHGSLSRELRLVVEQRLKRGELKAIVATSSLELGIDIGALDRVILVQTPFSVTSAVQRLGRAGHRVGHASRGAILALHGKDIVDAAVTARCVREQDISECAPVICPLDVLAQVLVSMTSVETWTAGGLYDAIRACFSFHSLPRRQFDLVLDMLAGTYEEARLRDLAPMVSYDRLDGTVRAKEGARMRLAMSGGTIPDRGYFSLRTADSKALIGELDEEFVWERSPGDSFVFGTQGWRIQKIDHQSVEVVPVEPRIGMTPFWKAEERNRDFHISERISQALEEWNGRLAEPGFPHALEGEYGLDAATARVLVAFLSRQKETSGADLPHRHHLLVEHTRDPAGKARGKDFAPGARGDGIAPGARGDGIAPGARGDGIAPGARGDGIAPGARGDGIAPGARGANVVLHTMWGGRVNRPFGLALSAAWEERYGYRPEMFQNDDAILLFLPEEKSAGEILSLVGPGALMGLLQRRLEGSGFFGARFRESAGRALLLPRASFRRRTPLWLTRQRAKSLLSAVSRHDDFPMILEAWRTCLQDEFDLASLAILLDELASGVIRIGEVSTPAPSPFCSELMWKQTSGLMYADDTPERSGDAAPGARAGKIAPGARAGGIAPGARAGKIAPGARAGKIAPGARADLVRELALSADLRPRIPPEVTAVFQAKCQRTAEGYAPRDARELLDWLKERVLLPREEWDALCAACARDHGLVRQSLERELGGKIVERSFGGQAAPCVLAAEVLPRVERSLRAADDDALEELLGEWLRFYGPIDPSSIARLFGLPQERCDALLEDLVEAEVVVLDRLVAGSDAVLLCDRENLETLLRISRARARPAVRTRALAGLPAFIARHQGLVRRGAGPEDMKEPWEKLFGFPLPASAWEEEVFPARIEGYRTRWLDDLLAGAGLLWLGCGRRKIAFCFAQDAELFLGSAPENEKLAAIFPGSAGRYSFWDLLDHSRLGSAELAERLWDFAWKGMASNTSFPVVRRGIDSDFGVEEAAREDGRRRRSFDQWKASRPATGFWFRIARAPGSRDALEEEEIVRDRIRQVLRRYGVIFRELLANELPPLRWARLFRSLRLMEFSGEVVTGRFFDGIPGLQFAHPSALEELAAEAGDDDIWWLNAADPASLCGVAIDTMKTSLPSRLPTTHVVFHGIEVVLVSRRKGLDLEFRVPPGEPRIVDYLHFVKVLTGRERRPLASVHVERINGEPAGTSPYKARLVEFGFVEDFRRLTYRAKA